MSKDNRVFYLKSKLSLFFILKRTSIGVHKNIIYQHICMTKYIFDRMVQLHPSMRSELYSLTFRLL